MRRAGRTSPLFILRYPWLPSVCVVVISLAGCSTRYMMRNYSWKRLWPPYAKLLAIMKLAKRHWPLSHGPPANKRAQNQHPTVDCCPAKQLPQSVCVQHLDGNCKEARADSGGCGSRNASPNAEVMAGRKLAPRRRANGSGRSRTDHSRTLTTIPAELGPAYRTNLLSTRRLRPSALTMPRGTSAQIIRNLLKVRWRTVRHASLARSP